MTDVYKQALCLFIQDGVLTLEQVQEQVKVAESMTIKRSRETPFWVAAEALCQRLQDGIVANSYRPFKMNVTNTSAMERLLRIDKVDESEAQMLIDWCLAHEFWAGVILSPAKFRKHYATMYVRRVEERNKRERDGAKEAHLVEVARPRYEVADQEFFEQKRREQAEAVPMPKDFKRVLGLAQ